MSSYFSRAVGLTALVLSSMALQACVDEPSPMESAAEACEATPTGCEPVPEARVIAGVITVTNTGGGMEVGSLRWAVAQAMPDDTIRFDPSLAGQTITVEATVKADGPMVIEGPADKGIVISGGLQHRVFDLTHPGTTVIRNLTITQGKPNDFGPGGGIMSTGTLVLEHTTVHGNEADVGSGVYATNLTLRNSTISGNTSNFAPRKYPAVVGAGRHVYENSTITGNSPAGIGGINGLTLRNSIVADNGTLNCTYPSGIVFEGTNLSNDDTCGGPSVIIIADPKLEALADNGGPNATHAFAAGSPAFDAATDCTVAVDQRYVPRDAKCDIGAFEFIDHTTIEITIDGSGSANRNSGYAVVTGTVTCSRDEAFGLVVDATQRQKAGRTPAVVEAAGQTLVECGTEPRPWSVILAPTGGAFRNGKTEIAVRTENTPGWAIPATAAKEIRLFWAHK